MGTTAETPQGEISPTPETAEEGCAAIRRALNRLAEAEREQAFALNLGAAPGSSTAMIEARLATVLDRTNRLRDTLREVSRKAPNHDPRIEQCTRMGYHALVEAQKLTTSVEELLRAKEAASSPVDQAKSGAAPAASGAKP